MEKDQPRLAVVENRDEISYTLTTGAEGLQFSENGIPCEWLSTKDAARYLCLTENALRICVHRNQVKAHKFGRRLRFKVSEVRQVLFKKGA